MLGLVGLEGAAGRRAGTFSLGMTQRLGIATALLGDPGVLLLDEPANGLDPEGIRWMRNLLRSLAAEGRVVFVSSHLIGEMVVTAERLVVVGQGRLLAQTSVAELAARSTSLEEAFLELTSGSVEYRAAPADDAKEGTSMTTTMAPGGHYRFRHAAAMEWIKLRSLRSTWWTLAVTVAGAAAIAVAVGVNTEDAAAT